MKKLLIENIGIHRSRERSFIKKALRNGESGRLRHSVPMSTASIN